MKKKLMKGLYILLSLAVGIFGAICLMELLPKDLSIPAFLFFYLLVMALFLISYLLATVLHEGGHLLFGLLSGYSFLSFRIGSLILKKEEGKLRFGKFSLGGTGGQCLMIPPEYREPYPCLLYNLGGVFMNLLTGLLFFLLSLSSKGVLQGFLRTSALLSLYMVLTNGIPFSDMVANDGYNALCCYKSEKNRKDFYQQMRIATLSHQGVRQKDMPEELFEGSGEGNDLRSYLDVARAGRYLDLHEFDKAEEALRKIAQTENCPLLFQSYVKNDLLYLDILKKEENGEIDQFYEELKKAKILKGSPSYYRSLYAYAVYKDDPKKKEGALKRFRDLAKTYPYPQEIQSEEELIALL